MKTGESQVRSPLVLGMDLGTSSVGWSLFVADEQGIPTQLLDLGVRHFEEVVEPKTQALKNLKRRQMRGMRRNLRRRRQRLDALLSHLYHAGLVASPTEPFADSEPTPHAPYELRSRAVSEPLTLQELGRALYHLARRRGFKSNRGAKLASLAGEPEVEALLATDRPERAEEQTEEEKEEGRVLGEIAAIRADMGSLTLGQHFYKLIQAGEKVRGRHTDRAMYEDEFERIWECQSRHHPEVLTNALKARIYHAIFDQRPLRVQKFLKAKCALEPEKVRAEKAQLVAQQFRYWQDLANLILTHRGTGERRALTTEERKRLADKLEGSATMTWSAVKKELGLSKEWEFNLERAKGGELKGNSTAKRIGSRAPELWKSLSEAQREQLVEILLTISDRGTLYRTLRRLYAIEPRCAYDLAVLDFEQGTASLSSKAMRRILKGMQAGMSRTEAQIAAGYEPWKEGVQPLAALPHAPSRLEMPNPRVRKALGQVRKVVNALIREYGRPEIIRLEMARDMSLTKKEKEAKEKANRQMEKENKEADEALKGWGIQEPTRADRIWYRLAKQCGFQCPYTGKTIPQGVDGMSRFQIEHIVPYSRSLDDSFNNLTLCEAEANRKKGNRTPFEAFGNTPEWEHMVARVMKWTGYGTNKKRSLFTRERLPESEEELAAFLSRQLNETRMICREAAKYLAPVCGRVEATKGQATAMLRSHWGLMEALYGVNEKRRDDLRHHAVDSVAVAFTSLSLFQKLTRIRKAGADEEPSARIEPLTKATVPPAPAWLHDALKARLKTVVVSHEPTRGILDALHKETAYGLRVPGQGVYHVRKPLGSLTDGEVDRIVDDKLRERVREARKAGGKDALKDGLVVTDRYGKTRRIRRARITVDKPKAPMLAVPAGRPTKYYELGNNHHVEIFEHEATGKRIGRFVTTLEAARRVRREKRPIVDTRPPEPGYRFVMWLAPNDPFDPDTQDGSVFVVESLWSTTNQIILRRINAGDAGDKESRLMKGPNTLRGAKLFVSAIGVTRPIPEGVV